MVLTDRLGIDEGFEKNQEAAEKRGIISPAQRAQVKQVVEIGHAATHRGHKPKADDLSAVLDVAEALCATLYVHDRKVTDAARNTPPRKPR